VSIPGSFPTRFTSSALENQRKSIENASRFTPYTPLYLPPIFTLPFYKHRQRDILHYWHYNCVLWSTLNLTLSFLLRYKEG
jgi:hypothetical protein